MKALDIHGAYCCSSCHDAVDGRTLIPGSRQTIKLMFLEGIIRTQEIMVSEGLIEFY